MFTDTHCHIHETRYEDSEGAYNRAMTAGVSRLICVGTDTETSMQAVEFASTHDNVWASVGVHPHEASDGEEAIELLESLLEIDSSGKIIAIGECGLDYFYTHSPKQAQIDMLRSQLRLAQTYRLPVIFHVRDSKSPGVEGSVWDDFWPIYDSYQGLRGVLHSYTDTQVNLHKALERGLYIGVNGISTFAKDKTDVFSSIPLDSLLLETDAPFLTPAPLRGNVNEPAFITHVAKFLSDLHSVNLQELSVVTQRNATTLFLNK